MRGRAVTVGGRQVVLGPNALALFKTLAASPTVVPRAELLRCLPEQSEEHALEVAMSRLRRTLDVPGLITTVVKRGYRLNASDCRPERHRTRGIHGSRGTATGPGWPHGPQQRLAMPPGTDPVQLGRYLHRAHDTS